MIHTTTVLVILYLNNKKKKKKEYETFRVDRRADKYTPGETSKKSFSNHFPFA